MVVVYPVARVTRPAVYVPFTDPAMRITIWSKYMPICNPMACVALRTEYVLITNPKTCVHSFLPAEIFDFKYQSASISTRNSRPVMHKKGQLLTPCLPLSP